ncbi:MAG: type I pullulanase [Lachnospiraceae bacterium]|nr:type I pullulanase [Lachnospiraceae bacterium]
MSIVITQKRSPVEWKHLFESEEFEQKYAYDGDDLGSIYSPDMTTFKVWAPTAEKVELKLYATGSDEEPEAALLRQLPMVRGEKGIWHASVKEDLENVYYTYLVTADGETRECVDIYAKATGVNGKRGMVVNPEATDPEGWAQERMALQSEEGLKCPVIYEVHVKDFSNDEHSGVPKKYRGKFMAFTCEDTGLDGDLSRPTCVSYLKKLGITHVHILPMYDYGSVDEAGDPAQFNWGYDPVNYNVPEGSYSTDPYHGEVRIKECKKMIQALHKAGIRVVMDVVYNHTYSINSWFQATVPYYYYRLNEDGSFSNGSVCSNDTASERAMYRKFMVDSVIYWAKEYHLDGFRFDLMGLHDVETMNTIRHALNELPDGKNIMMYGEPWAGGPTAMKNGSVQALKANVALLEEGISFFNDDTRDAIKGSVFIAEKPGFVNGQKGLEDKIRSSVLAWCDGKGGYEPHGPKQVLSYVSAHDNYTLWDKLLYTKYEKPDFKAKDEVILTQNRLAAGIYFTCLGIPFFQAGEEGVRTKLGIGDSYCSPADVNQLDWKRIYEYNEMSEYYAGLIALRKAFSGYQEADKTVTERIRFVEVPKDMAAFVFEDGKGRELFVVYNAGNDSQEIALPEGEWKVISDGIQFKRDGDGGLLALGTAEGTVRAAAVSVTILGR